MIKLTKMDGNPVVINSDLIESVEATPDTVIRLTSAKRLLVRESVDEVVARALDYQRSLRQNAPPSPAEV